MNEKQYLDQLDLQLVKLNEKERADIRRDFEEYFENGRQEGKSIEEIISGLGTPEEIAVDLLNAYSEEDFVKEVSIASEQLNGPYNKIEAEVKNVNLIVLPTDRDEAYLEVKDQEERTESSMEIKGDTLFIKVKRNEIVKKFFFITFVGNFGNTEAILYIPKRQLQSIEIKNNDGKIKVSDVLANEYKLKSDNGRIVMENIVASKVKARSDNGRIILTNSQINSIRCATSNGKIINEHVTGDDIELESSNGGIQMVEVFGAIDAKTSNGRIEAKLSNVVENSTFFSGNGSIKVYTPKPLENTIIKTSTNWGSVSLYGQSSKEYLNGEPKVKLKLHSGNGKILVEQQLLQEV